MNDKNISTSDKIAPVEKPSPQPETATADRKENPAKPKGNGGLFGFTAFVLIAGAGWLLWQNKIPSLPLPKFVGQEVKQPAKPVIVPDQAIPSSEEISRFRIVKQELLELRNSHEALSRAFLQLQKEVAALQASSLQEPVSKADNAAAQPSSPPVIALSAPLAQDNLQTTVAGLTAKIEALEQAYHKQSAASGLRLRMVQLANDIGEKMETGDAFSDEVGQLKALSEEYVLPRNSLSILEQNAENGILPLDQLIAEFKETAQAALPASIAADKNATFGDSIRAQLGNLITIRKVEVDSADDSDEANIARAEAELQAGNVDMALTHLHQLTEDPKGVFATWVMKANNYVDSHEALHSIKDVVLQTPVMIPLPAAKE